RKFPDRLPENIRALIYGVDKQASNKYLTLPLRDDSYWNAFETYISDILRDILQKGILEWEEKPEW
ncbi:MAG: hypothetical protein GXO27_03640, partial [Chlorobi bacterium]|nr:hypothetical protein [Chlorobiota bacterium]